MTLMWPPSPPSRFATLIVGLTHHYQVAKLFLSKCPHWYRICHPGVFLVIFLGIFYIFLIYFFMYSFVILVFFISPLILWYPSTRFLSRAFLTLMDQIVNPTTQTLKHPAPNSVVGIVSLGRGGGVIRYWVLVIFISFVTVRFPMKILWHIIRSPKS